jgi:predicted MPP superfamily phosphohydrolase
MGMEKINVLTVGDIHGKSIWKDFIFGSYNAFEDWAEDVNDGKIPAWEQMLAQRFSDVDHIVFVGDYFDSFTVDNVTMKHNAEDLFLFKRSYPNKVTLLIGNHDVSYTYREEACSGFRGEMFFDFNELLRNNKEHLQLAYQIGNVLWTHAGVTNHFYDNYCISKAKEIEAEYDRWNAVVDSPMNAKDGSTVLGTKFVLTKYNIANFLNDMWLEKWKPLFNVGKRRGGYDSIPGPLWADQAELLNDMLEDVFQFVGHTPVDEVKGTYDEKTGVSFVDCLERGIFKGVVVVEIEDDKYVNCQVSEHVKL